MLYHSVCMILLFWFILFSIHFIFAFVKCASDSNKSSSLSFSSVSETLEEIAQSEKAKGQRRALVKKVARDVKKSDVNESDLEQGMDSLVV